MLKDIFFHLSGKYTTSTAQQEKFWQEIETNYTEKHRYYHTLAHIESLITELEPYKDAAADYDILLFSAFYHDIIYNVPGKGNEEKSAVLAKERLQALQIAPERIALCEEQILATKTHKENAKFDINLFTDADLAVLGKSEVLYKAYTDAIRKEYRLYPDFLYYNGRKGVLKYFLGMERIYKTPDFSAKYEKQARENLARELALLS